MLNPAEPLTEPELRALALKIVEGKVFGMWNVPENLWLLVFMPLGFMKKRELLKHKADTVYAIYGEDTSVPGRAISGYPMFAACRFLPRAQFARMNELVAEAQAQRKAFLKTPRGRKRPGWKKELTSALKRGAADIARKKAR